MTKELPIIDLAGVNTSVARLQEVALELDAACRNFGFFYVKNTNVPQELVQSLLLSSKKFFSLPLGKKENLDMSGGGLAWRGYFKVGAELTSGQPDQKEGLYFGEELANEQVALLGSTPLFGKNLFPEEVPQLRSDVLQYMQSVGAVGHTLMRCFSQALGLDPMYFHEHYTSNPLYLFRIFHYPKLQQTPASASTPRWGVGEHTDYGILTILLQDENAGLEVKVNGKWVTAPPVPGTFVCNIGDMLERLTRGSYVSTTHRVVQQTEKNRISCPFFFDPNYFAPIEPLPIPMENIIDATQRWDGNDVHLFQGTYGEYVTDKVSKVFPTLWKKIFEKTNDE